MAILVAGYIASIGSDQHPIAGMVQQVSKQVSEISEQLDEIRPSVFTDPIIQQAHTEKADQELDKILMLRAVDPLRARQNIQELWRRTGEEGDLSTASNPNVTFLRGLMPVEPNHYCLLASMGA